MSWPESWLSVPYCDEPEDIDAPGQPPDQLARSMRDVALTNRLFGGTQTILSHVARLLRPVPAGTEVSILDIGTGSGDIPAALSAWGKTRGLRLTIVAVDNQRAMLDMARVTNLRSPGGVHLAQADANALPFPPGAFDLAVCALAFHHLGFSASARVLAAMDRLTVRGFVVSDLRRDRLSLWGVQASVAALRTHPFTRHDAPASVRRAWTPPEYRKMVALSGVRNVRITTPWYFRVALVQDKMGRTETVSRTAHGA